MRLKGGNIMPLFCRNALAARRMVANGAIGSHSPLPTLPALRTAAGTAPFGRLKCADATATLMVGAKTMIFCPALKH